MDLGLNGLKVLITGGSKGIGRHCAEILVREGAKVSICARTAADVQQAASDMGVDGTAVDVSDKAALENWVVCRRAVAACGAPCQTIWLKAPTSL
jgi:3-oxoacyl-[acyl-carrier protein] reductase